MLATGGPGDARRSPSRRGRGGGRRRGVRRRRHHHAGGRRAGRAPRCALGVIPGRDRQPARRQPPHPQPRPRGPRGRCVSRPAPPLRPRPHGAARRRPLLRRGLRGRATTRGSWPRPCREHKRRWGMARLRRRPPSGSSASIRSSDARHHHRRRGVRRPCRDGAGRQLRRGDSAVRAARARHPPRRRPARRRGGPGRQLRARACAPSGTCCAIAPATLGEDTFVGYARGREIRVETDPVQPVQLDGEPGGETPFTATVVPGAIRIMVPVAGHGVGRA